MVRIFQIDRRPQWPEAEGKLGIVVTMTKRLHIPAAKVMVLGEIAEFDLNELEVISENRGSCKNDDRVYEGGSPWGGDRN